VAVFLKRFLAPEWVFIFGIEWCIEADAPWSAVWRPAAQH
jgi:hypothetical protein